MSIPPIKFKCFTKHLTVNFRFMPEKPAKDYQHKKMNHPNSLSKGLCSSITKKNVKSIK